MSGRKRDQIARWVESASGHLPTPDEARCLEALCVIDTGPHNIHPIGGWRGPGVWWGRHAVGITMRNRDLSTTDSDAMTRLVLAAHRLAVRVNVSSAIMGVDLAPGAVGDEVDDYVHIIYEPGDERGDHEWWESGITLLAHARKQARPGLSGMVSHPTLDQLAYRTGVGR